MQVKIKVEESPFREYSWKEMFEEKGIFIPISSDRDVYFCSLPMTYSKGIVQLQSGWMVVREYNRDNGQWANLKYRKFEGKLSIELKSE